MKRIIGLVLTVSVVCSLVGCASPSPTVGETDKTIVESMVKTVTEESLADKVVYDVEDGINVCLMRFTNSSDIPVEIEVNFVFNNDEKKENAGYGHLYCLGAGESGVISMKKPTDENQVPIEGVTTEYVVSINESGLFNSDASFKKDITVEDSQSEKAVTVTVHNNSEKDIGNVTVAIIYYSGDNIVWYNDYGYDISAGSEYYWTFDEPNFYDTNNTSIPFDRYEIVLNDAFNYKN